MGSFPDYDRYDGLGLAALIAAKEVSATEVLEAAIERIEARNPALNAVIFKAYEDARRQVENIPATGCFAGVPFLVKDLLIECVGMPNTAGSRYFGNQPSNRDSELTKRYRRAGLVLLGRTNTPELGIMGITEPERHGPTRNPWALDRTPGGSSGGSAAAVAAGMVPMAHGGDGGGSIRIPAAYCGLVGLKPTRGRTPLGPSLGESWGGLVVQHALTRTVRDTAALLDLSAGADPGAPFHIAPLQRPLVKAIECPPPSLRIAFSVDPMLADDQSIECRGAVLEAAELLATLGHRVEEAAPALDREILRRAFLIEVALGVALSVRMRAEALGRAPRAHELELPTRVLMRIGARLSALDREWSRHQVHAASLTLHDFFQKYDVFMNATTAHPPAFIGAFRLRGGQRFMAGMLEHLPLEKKLMTVVDRLASESMAATPNTQVFNLTGLPAISLPLAVNAAGLPIGVQFAAAMGGEECLLRLAAQIEKARPWSERRPSAWQAVGPGRGGG